MDNPRIDAPALTRAGTEALRRGEMQKARELFGRIVAAGADDASSCLGLAYACRSLGDGPAALSAVDRALSHAPGDIRALVLKGDLLGDAGDPRAAMSFYLEAIKAGGPPDEQMPPPLRKELARAQAMCDRFAERSEAFVRDRLAAEGLVERRSTARFRQSLDILFRKKKVYFQEPRSYFFPELPQVQFYEREDFPWVGAIEAATEEVRVELVEVMKDSAAFTPYVHSDPRRPPKAQEGMRDNLDWSAFYLWKDGRIVAENAARCPRTMAALEHVPLTRVRNRFPGVLFSQLRPGARIPPHTGLINTRLICHLPLIVPEGCSFRVGNETRAWQEGRVLLFDDTIEHEAWNTSERTRVVLLFEVWRPELSEEERGLVRAMIEAIDEGGGSMLTSEA
jgi:aspartate beta-hydroxylase